MLLLITAHNIIELVSPLDILADNPNNPGQDVSTVFMNRVSPEVIFLRPPDKLGIEIKVSGRYSRLNWQRNSVPLNAQQNFYNYYEIYFRGVTTTDDLGLYEVEPFLSPPLFNQLILPPELDFVVILPGKLLKYIISYIMLDYQLHVIQLMPTQQPILNQWCLYLKETQVPSLVLQLVLLLQPSLGS